MLEDILINIMFLRSKGLSKEGRGMWKKLKDLFEDFRLKLCGLMSY